ncbi:MAG: Polysaccharide pyruvyl transferase [Bacteroidetes bacterium ADurb.Bin408]|nr:MAG: Polysaccharide pyruvyl transferase [Bacteroidetes bacterium ADurb.Bin408]
MNADAHKKLHIGIITFHRAINYGAILQAYALQHVVEKMGCDCNVIDYRNKVLESKHKKVRLRDCRNPLDMARFIFYSGHNNRKYDKFRDFLNTHIKMSSTCNSTEDLQRIAPQYDRFICGSDQVWNHRITNFDKNYFLDFCNNPVKKNSYAASFGFSSLSNEYVEKYQLLLKGFNKIAVRESQGKEIIRKLIGKNVDVVLDPTMLLDGADWAKIACEYRTKNYILVYAFGRTSETMKIFIEKLAFQTKCSVVYISPTIYKQVKATYEKCIGPAEFLGLFKNAKYVVTNSFHGTAFALIFNKNFFLEMLPESQGVNSRLENILNVFELHARQIINGDNAHILKAINYNNVNMILETERQKALEYLQQIVHY